ncbi:MAG: class I SAM-dependent methyltransferase [Acidimicrobiia bacterium]
MSLRDAWDSHAEEWTRWARAPGHDSYWRFHRRRFLDLLPPPGRLTVDIGAGEGRVGRDLQERGHAVVSLDASPRMIRACAQHPVAQPTILANAVALPVRSEVADLGVAFMSLQDMDHYEAAVAEAARVLVPGGRLCLAVVHPISSAGGFEGERAVDDPFVIRGSYLEERRRAESFERDGLTMTFHSFHRSLEAYSRALESAGFIVEALREVTDDNTADRWHRIPLFLHLRARRAG